MHRAATLYVVLGCVVASALVAQRFLLLSPPQRAYWWPEAEAEILTPFTVTVPFTGRVLEPHVALVLALGPRQPGQWMSVPVSAARYALRTLFPRPVLPEIRQVLALAGAAAAVLYLIVLTLARSIAAQSSRPKPTSLPGC